MSECRDGSACQAERVLEDVKMALRMPGTGSYVDWAREVRDAYDKNGLMERRQELGLNRYQKAAHATKAQDLGFKTAIAVDALGLIGEAAEFSEHIKKVLGHGHDADINLIAEELGDTLWYLAECASNFGLSLGDIARMNLEKLAKRYPGGEFDSKRSQNRAEDGDKPPVTLFMHGKCPVCGKTGCEIVGHCLLSGDRVGPVVRRDGGFKHPYLKDGQGGDGTL